MSTNSSAPVTLSSGWVSGSNRRGTLDIIWSCLFTIFLCIWSVQCLNVPAIDDSFWRILSRKVRWALLAVFGPEILLCFTIGQWASARRNVEAFHRLGHSDWSMTHAFFADMGGFFIRLQSGVAYPLTGCHLHYLVYHQYIDLPPISKKDIEDKSKADGWTKFLTCLQTTWFLMQCLARAVSHQTITTLELSTTAFVLCTLVTYYCWYQKPQDVYRPVIIPAEQLKRPLPPIPTETGAQAPLSILDFADDMRPSWSLTVMPHLGFPNTGPRPRPFDRIPNDRFPEIGVRTQMVLCLITAVYSSFHLLGWNFVFATSIELWFWRGASIIQSATTVTFWIFDEGQRLYAKKFMRPRKVYAHETQDAPQDIELILRQPSIRINPPDAVAAQYASGVDSPTREPISRGMMKADTFPMAAPRNKIGDFDVRIEPVAGNFGSSSDGNHLALQKSADSEPIAGIPSDYDVPFWQVLVTTSCTALYAVARAYLAIEVFLGLRSLPENAYDQVNWSNVLPGLS